jgi:hypothetical protein
MYLWLLRREVEGIGHRLGDRVGAMDIGQGEDFPHMGRGVAVQVQQALVILGCLRAEGEEARERVGILGVAAYAISALAGSGSAMSRWRFQQRTGRAIRCRW